MEYFKNNQKNIAHTLNNPSRKEDEQNLNIRQLIEKAKKHLYDQEPQDWLRLMSLENSLNSEDEDIIQDPYSQLLPHLALYLSHTDGEIINALALLDRQGQVDMYSVLLFQEAGTLRQELEARQQELARRRLNGASWWPQNSTWGAVVATVTIGVIFLFFKP